MVPETSNKSNKLQLSFELVLVVSVAMSTLLDGHYHFSNPSVIYCIGWVYLLGGG